MRLITFEYSHIFKFIMICIPCIACSIWYFYHANSPLQSSQFVEHFFNRAQQFHAEGKTIDAKQEYLQLLEHDPHCGPAHFNLGQLYAGDEEWEKACEHYKIAIASDSIHESQMHLIHFCYGTALFRLNNLQEAKKELDLSLSLCPMIKVFMQRALVLQQLGQLDAAKADLDRVVQSEPSYASAYLELGGKFRDIHNFKQAISCFEQHIQYYPQHYGGYLFLGDVLHMESKQKEDDALFANAMQQYKKAIECNPSCYHAQVNLGLMHLELDDDETAVQLLSHAYANNPEFPNANIAKGICQIKRSELPQGWDGYEWRTVSQTNRFAQIPQWDGHAPLTNKTIILHAEQGYGDTLHFVRYAKIAKTMGARVILESQDRLKNLLSLCPYIDSVITQHDPIPTADYQLPLLSMPTVLRTTYHTIPQEVPYLYADKKLLNFWKKELAHDHQMKVGICWKVNKQHDFTKYSNERLNIQIPTPRRSIPLASIQSLLAVEGVTFYSLQFDTDEKDPRIHTFAELDIAAGPFMDTAAIIQNLDLVITVDTSIAHLAGGLGAKTWILLPFAAEWRWFKNATSTPWYPTAQLFRCPAKNEWQTVINRVKKELTLLVANKQK